jgi:hypothetical protein
MWQRCVGAAASGGAELMMHPDVQDMVCDKIFHGQLVIKPHWEPDGDGGFVQATVDEFECDGMQCFFHNFERSPVMAKAAVVCKAWHQKHKSS